MAIELHVVLDRNENEGLLPLRGYEIIMQSTMHYDNEPGKDLGRTILPQDPFEANRSLVRKLVRIKLGEDFFKREIERYLISKGNLDDGTYHAMLTDFPHLCFNVVENFEVSRRIEWSENYDREEVIKRLFKSRK